MIYCNKEIFSGGALRLKDRQFKSLVGGGFRLEASFEPEPEFQMYEGQQANPENIVLIKEGGSR